MLATCNFISKARSANACHELSFKNHVVVFVKTFVKTFVLSTNKSI